MIETISPVETRHEPKTRGLAARPRWERRYASALLVVDALGLLAATAIAELIRFESIGPSFKVSGVVTSHAIGVAVLLPTWLMMLAVTGAYDRRQLGNGFDEYRRVVNAALRLFAVLAIALYLTNSDLSRGFVAVLVPAVGAATMTGRHIARKVLHHQRSVGRAQSRVLAVGSRSNVHEMSVHLQRAPWAGYTIVGACVPSSESNLTLGMPTFAATGPEDIVAALRTTGADVLIISDTTAVPIGALRTLAWQLEGTGVELVVAPAITDVAGPRISIRPVAGLPLLHVEEPKLEGAARVFKAVFDRTVGLSSLVLLSPLLIVMALAVKVTSRGPAFYRQVRVGKNGHEFTMLKFRTMRDNADEELAALLDLNRADGPLFKIPDDPRLTRVGRVLRRCSLDELAQLVNVVRGEMSIVGPRPPLPAEVAQYADDVRRRFLVKPGLTGLWQVNGRADLSWDESVRLDLHYVDHWSPALDFVILAKTLAAVARGTGAY
jgi:exopolysaccharide biosynthesis polyprenyl glycosylphosphotransferase